MALAYHWDHREALELDIERRLAEVDRLERTAPPVPLRDKLRAKGLIR